MTNDGTKPALRRSLHVELMSLLQDFQDRVKFKRFQSFAASRIK